MSMGRIRTFLNRDADDFCDQLAAAEVRFFRRDPWRAHGLAIVVLGASFAALWIMGGLRTALVLFVAWVGLFAVVTVIASAWMKRHR